MKTLKAKLRAWLIDLVREAIRLDRKQQLGLNGIEYVNRAANTGSFSAVMRDSASKPVTATPTPLAEKTFEQFQDESIAEQANFYAPKEQP